MSRTPLRPGVYAPTLTFFHPDTEDLDTVTIRRHAVRLAKAGLVGLITAPNPQRTEDSHPRDSIYPRRSWFRGYPRHSRS